MSCRYSRLATGPDLRGQLLGDFEVAITGGFWVAAGAFRKDFAEAAILYGLMTIQFWLHLPQEFLCNLHKQWARGQLPFADARRPYLETHAHL